MNAPFLSKDAELLLKATMHGLPKDDLPLIPFSEATLKRAEEINLAELLDSRSYGPYTLINLINATRRLRLFTENKDELILVNEVRALYDDMHPQLKKMCAAHVRDCGAVLRHPNLNHPSFHIRLQDTRQ